MNTYLGSEMVNIQGVNDPSMLNPGVDKLQTEANPVRVLVGYHTHKVKPKSDISWFVNKRMYST